MWVNSSIVRQSKCQIETVNKSGWNVLIKSCLPLDADYQNRVSTLAQQKLISYPLVNGLIEENLIKVHVGGIYINFMHHQINIEEYV